jgi:hypothetical protein
MLDVDVDIQCISVEMLETYTGTTVLISSSGSLCAFDSHSSFGMREIDSILTRHFLVANVVMRGAEPRAKDSSSFFFLLFSSSLA